MCTCQDFADNFLSFFFSDDFAEVILLGEKAAEHIGHLFAQILEDVCGPVGLSLLEKLSTVSAASPLVEALERLKRVARAVCHVTNILPDKTICVVKSADVQYVSAYGGRQPLERQWKTWLGAGWWAEEVTTILKTSGSSVLLEPRVAELEGLLDDDAPLSQQHLQQAIDLYAQVACTGL